jgi:uncharacterized protein (TIGR03437 family)
MSLHGVPPVFRRSYRYLLPLLLTTTCLAEAIAVTPIDGASGTDPRPFVIGWEFSAASATTITGLAYLDATGSGLTEAHQVGIFNAADGSLLISATVPAGPSTPMVNGFRVSPVSYNLAPGTYVIAGLKSSNNDYAIVRSSGVTSVAGITYLEERELQTDSFTMPTTHFVDNEVGSFGPSFTVVSATSAPEITAVANGASFQPAFAPNTYISILGSGLSNSTRTWTTTDFANGTQLPKMIDSVSATVNGVPAYVEYVSASQVNLITPAISVTGSGIPLVLSVPGRQPVTAWLEIQPTAPAFFTWQTGTADSGKYLVAQHADYSNVGKPGLFPDKPANYTTPARPGETILLYGTGLASANPVSGVITDGVYGLSPLPTATVGNLPAAVQFAGLIPGFAQLYQVNITIPAGTSAGDMPFIVIVNGVASAAGLITIGN